MLIIYRLLANIPVPGVNLQAWLAFTSQDSGNAVVNFLDLLSGGAVRNFSVMAMGVYPYITASIIIQLLTPIIPQLKEMDEEGESGRNRKNKLTYYFTVPLAFLQAIGQIRLIGFSLPGGIESIMPNFGFGPGDLLPTITTLMAMVGGTMFAIWIGERITEEGIGQGISLIIFSGIVSGILPALAQLFTLEDTVALVFTLVAFLVLLIVTVLVIVVIQEGERRITVKYSRSIRGRKQYQAQSTYIPLKVNTAGMIPIIFAQSLLTFPPLIAGLFISGSGSIVDQIATSISNFGAAQDPAAQPLAFFFYWFFYFVLVVGFTFFYTDVMVRQQNLAQNLKRNNGIIPGLRPGAQTERYITSIVRRITLVGALFLGIIAILPGIMAVLSVILRIEGLEQSALIISGAGLIIVVGVVLDTMRQLDAEFKMRGYERYMMR
jgi:preprotein translocase subunit SecY